MSRTNENYNKFVIRGLRGVAAATTQISFVDPLGALYYSGYNIDDLVCNATFEEIVHLLLNNKLPTKTELHNLKKKLYSEMRLPEPVVQRIKSASITCHPMDILCTEVSHLGEFDPERDDTSDAANKRRAIRIIAKVPTLISFLYRTRKKQDVLLQLKNSVYLETFCICSEENMQINKKKTL